MTLQVSPASTEERGAALRLFYQHQSEQEREASLQRTLAFIAKGEFPSEGLLICREGADCLGVIVSQSLPGAAGLVWPPQVVQQHGQELVEKLLVEAAIAWLHSCGAKLVQAILSAADEVFAKPLVRNGFSHVTTLLFWQKELQDPDASWPTTELRCQSWTSCDQAQFRATLMESYEQTLDFPELNDLRNSDDIGAGYQAMPGCRLDRWWLVWEADRPVGVLITASAPDESSWELAYVGLVPSARGRGLGTTLTRAMLSMARSVGAGRVLLTVDARNLPARRMYQALGFQQFDSREVYLAVPCHGS